MPCYYQLKKQLVYLEPDKINQIRQAYLLSAQYHKGQKRVVTGEEYIVHPVNTAITLAKLHLDHQCIIAALLHDTLEDTTITKEEITTKFGEPVANLVDGLTKLTQIEAIDKNEAHAQNFRKMMLAMSQDIRVIIIKLADRLHNMQTINKMIPEARQRIARETLSLYAPIANRLGMYKIHTELEDLAFAALYPRRYAILKQAIEQVYGKNREIIKLLSHNLHHTFAQSTLKNTKISGRMKHIYGIYKKMLSHHASFANIMDIYAFRIIVQDISDCYRALGIVHNLYKPIPGKFKDHIAIPKFNGYQSLHTVLFGPSGAPVEMQIRTQDMEQMASDGIAAHWLYKTHGEVVNTSHVRAQQWVNKLIEMQQQTNSSIEFFESVKIDLFPDKVYVFTPKGDIVELANGATPVDFAYALHSKIGNSCVAASINRKFSPLSTILQNGQTVSIITADKEEPSPAWLSFVTTAKARNSIRHHLKHKKRSELISLGKKLLDKACNDIGVSFFKIKPLTFDNLIKNLNLKRIDELYENIGIGNYLALLVAYQLIHGKIDKKKAAIYNKTKPLLIYGTEGTAINFSKCCYPIPGDTICGYLNVGIGLDIHTKTCSSCISLRKNPEKCLPVAWAKNVLGDFYVELTVELTNQLGLAQLTLAVSRANAHIYALKTNERTKNYLVLTLLIMVKNIMHLERVKRHISNISTVVGVTRKQQ